MCVGLGPDFYSLFANHHIEEYRVAALFLVYLFYVNVSFCIYMLLCPVLLVPLIGLCYLTVLFGGPGPHYPIGSALALNIQIYTSERQSGSQNASF